jgi:hypothetical protein
MTAHLCTYILQDAELIHRRNLNIAGARVEFMTNAPELAELLRTCSQPSESGSRSFRMQVSVTDRLAEIDPRPHFRGLQHLLIAHFGETDLFVYDVLRKNAGAVVSRSTAADVNFWRHVALPISLGILGATAGIVPVHCAALAIEEQGLLIAGQSGAGKSTLALALAQAGFTLVSDDWTYIKDEGGLLANGLFAPIKLLPDAVRHFPELAALRVTRSMNGELAFDVDATRVFRVAVGASCRPRNFMFLQRSVIPGARISPVPSDLAARYLQGSVERVPHELASAYGERSRVLAEIAKLPCWIFRYGGPPGLAAGELRRFVSQRMEALIA